MCYGTAHGGHRLAPRTGLALPSRSTVAAFAGVFAGGILIPALAGWVPVDGLPLLSALVLTAILTSSVREPSTPDRAIMRPAFVIIFSSLMLLGGPAATAVAAAAALTPG